MSVTTNPQATYETLSERIDALRDSLDVDTYIPTYDYDMILHRVGAEDAGWVNRALLWITDGSAASYDVLRDAPGSVWDALNEYGTCGDLDTMARYMGDYDCLPGDLRLPTPPAGVQPFATWGELQAHLETLDEDEAEELLQEWAYLNLERDAVLEVADTGNGSYLTYLAEGVEVRLEERRAYLEDIRDQVISDLRAALEAALAAHTAAAEGDEVRAEVWAEAINVPEDVAEFWYEVTSALKASLEAALEAHTAAAEGDEARAEVWAETWSEAISEAEGTVACLEGLTLIEVEWRREAIYLPEDITSFYEEAVRLHEDTLAPTH